MAQIRVTPSGILDKDGELSYISNGNYVDGNDIRHRQVDGNNFGGIMSTEGNKNPISLVNGSSSSILPAISTSTKKYRIYLDYSKVASGATTTMSGTLYLENSTGSVFSQVVSLTPSSFSNFAQSMQSQFDTLHLTAFGSGSFTKVPSGAPYYTSTGTNTGYFTLETSSDTDYVLKVKNGNSEIPLCRIVLETEYIATSTTLRPIGSYQFENYLFVWSASETVTTGVTSAVSEIGIIYSTTQGESYQYKTLVRSRKLGFSKERRIEAQIEKVGNQINLYWTDGNAKPRAMYLKYNLATTQNGFMFWEGGRYELETIDDESSYFYKVPSAYFTNIEVLNTGGTLTSGNKRYTGRFLTEDFVATEFLYPTNPINIYLADTKEPYKIHGDDSTVVTTKSVKLTLTNFPKGIYKYFELVSIEYVDNSYFATIVQRYTIDDNVTELEVIHTKNGQDNIPLGANELVAIYSRYLTVENLRIFDSRMVLSNLIEQVDLDLSTWAQNITHSLEYKTIDPVGNVVEDAHDFLASSILSDSPSPAMNGLKYGLEEYLDPKNVLDNTSYVFNDTYRFGIQVKWKSTGKWSAPYYVDDIRFDSLSYNINSGDTRRTANNITSNLTDINGNPCVYYVKFGGIDLDFSVGGKPIRDLIDGFRFVRAERIPEVLATGYFFLGQIDTDGKAIPFKVGQSSTTTTYSFAPTDVVTSTTINKGSAHGFFENQPVFYTEGSGTINNLVDGHYYFVNVISANEFALRVTPGGSLLTLTPVTGTTADFAFSSGYAPSTHSISPSNGSNVLFFHSPDNYYLDRVYDFDTTKHSIKILGPSKQNINITTHGTSGTGPIGCYADLSGYFSSAKRQYLTLSSSTTPAVTDYAILELNQDKSLPGASRTANNKLNIINDVFGLSTPLRYSGGSYFSGGLANNENNGIYYGQIYIDLGSDKKYPVNVENTLYHNIGHYYYLTAGQSGLLGNISVFGGDSYIQKTHLPISIREGNIGGTMIGCYSQNVVNTQMFSVIEDDNSTSGAGFKWPEYPNTDAVTHYIRPSYFSGVINAVGKIWDSLSDFLSSTKIPQRSYNASYNYNDDTIIEQGFLFNDDFDGTSPTKIIWSAKKITNSTKDGYRLGFQPSDFAELDITYGPIVHHEVINNAFYTIQPFSFQRQYFRDASLLGSEAGTDVVIGSGSILGAPGVELTSIGADFKWSIVKGQNPNGKETLYWYNNQLKKIARLAQDGVNIISDRGLISYLQNNTKWLIGQKYPLTGYGIHGVWNDKHSEAIFTLKALNPNVPAWVTATSYTTGAYVYISPIGTYLHASNLPYVYVAKQNHTSGASTKPETGANWTEYWTKITPGTNPETHTLVTLVYDEMKNGFICTHSYWPDIYMRYQNVFWSPDPLAPNTLYLHESNTNSLYYGSQFTPTITLVMNYDPNLSKNFEAMQVASDDVISQIKLYTKNHESYLNNSDFEYREDYYYSTIKNDILTAPGGSPNEDTSRLWGKWLKLKFYLNNVTKKQKLINAIVKFRPMPRLYN